MTSPETCGEGLAEHASLPDALSALLRAMAENLRLHQDTLDLRDAAAQREHEVYVTLDAAYREIAARLDAVAVIMAEARALPMGRHLPQKLADRALHVAFAEFVQREAELLALLQQDLERDRVMLQASR